MSVSRRLTSGRWRRSSPFEAQEIEGDQRGLPLAAVGQQRAKVAPPVVPQHHRLAIDERLIDRQAAHRLNDPHESVSEVRTASGPDMDALVLLANDDTEAGQAINQRRLARADEAGRRALPPTRTGCAPRCVPQVETFLRCLDRLERKFERISGRRRPLSEPLSDQRGKRAVLHQRRLRRFDRLFQRAIAPT
jgi:hypothetical protein